MRRTLVLLTLVLLLVTTAALAGDKGGKMTVDQKLDKMSAELNLTAEQRAQLKPILGEQMKQYETIANDRCPPDEAKKEKKMSLKKTWQSQIDTVLTTEQRQKLAEMHSAKEKH